MLPKLCTLWGTHPVKVAASLHTSPGALSFQGSPSPWLCQHFCGTLWVNHSWVIQVYIHILDLSPSVALLPEGASSIPICSDLNSVMTILSWERCCFPLTLRKKVMNSQLFPISSNISTETLLIFLSLFGYYLETSNCCL